MRRLRVLISAFALSPFEGSEDAVGWCLVTRLSRYHDVTVICGDVAANGPTSLDLSKYLAHNGEIPNLKIRYIEPSRPISVLEKISRVPGMQITYYLAYLLWQRAALRVATDLHIQKPFDIIHQLNMIGFREPGSLWKLPNRFIWGPIGGA